MILLSIIISLTAISISIYNYIVALKHNKYLHIHIKGEKVDKIRNVTNAKRCFDPHHDDSIEWMYRNGKFYQKQLNAKEWV